MNHGDFKIGLRFKCGGNVWMCTDTGTRTVAAVCLSVCQHNDYARGLNEETQDKLWRFGAQEVDPSWLSGPPYALAEEVFDEDDFPGCDVA